MGFLTQNVVNQRVIVVRQIKQANRRLQCTEIVKIS